MCHLRTPQLALALHYEGGVSLTQQMDIQPLKFKLNILTHPGKLQCYVDGLAHLAQPPESVCLIQKDQGVLEEMKERAQQAQEGVALICHLTLVSGYSFYVEGRLTLGPRAAHHVL